MLSVFLIQSKKSGFVVRLKRFFFVRAKITRQFRKQSRRENVIKRPFCV